MNINRSLIAFLLAGLTAGVLFTCFNGLSSAVLGRDGIIIRATKDADVDSAVATFNALNLKGIRVEKISHFSWSPENVTWTLFAFTIGFMIITGFVLFFYKLYCRWLDAEHHL